MAGKFTLVPISTGTETKKPPSDVMIPTSTEAGRAAIIFSLCEELYFYSLDKVTSIFIYFNHDDFDNDEFQSGGC